MSGEAERAAAIRAENDAMLVEGDQPLPYPDPFAEVDPLVINDGEGNLVFAVRHDGTVEMPDPEKAELAAAIFWREVLAMADDLGIQVVTR